MDISVREQDHICIVKLKGPFYLGQPVDEFRSTMEGQFRKGQYNVVLNVAEVPKVDSSGIGALVRAQTTAAQQGGALKLVGPTAIFTAVLKLVGLTNVIEVHSTDTEAMATFHN